MIRLLWRGLCGLIVCGLTLPPRLATAGIAIDHRPIGCMVAGKFPRLEARFDPAGQVSRARIDFHAEGDTRWYFVEMKPEGGVHRGILPQPLKSTKTVHYYIEVTGRDTAEGRTEEYSPIVASAGECDKKGLLTASPVTKALVTVKSAGQPTAAAAAGSPTVPAGFASAGIVGAAGAAATGAGAAATAAAGGVSGGVVAAGVVGAGAAIAGAVAIAGGNESTTTTIPPFTGRWVGKESNIISLDAAPTNPICTQETDDVLDMTQSGSSLSGVLRYTITSTSCSASAFPVGFSASFSVTGTASGSSGTFQNARGLVATATVVGNTMSGTFTNPIGSGSTQRGTFSLVRQ